MTPVRAPVVTGPAAVENKQRRGRGGWGDPRSCFLVTAAGPLRSGQDLTGSAVLASVALLLSHRDHEPSCEASVPHARPGNHAAGTSRPEDVSANGFANETLQNGGDDVRHRRR